MFCCVFIRGKHPVCGEPLFCFSANPDSLSLLCGFHIDHRSRSFLLKVSGVSSHLSFCCTSLVSGFIIHIPERFVYSQSAQGEKYKIVQFLKNSRWNVQNAAFCRPVRTIGTFGEKLCSQQGGVLGSHSKVAQKFRAVCGGFCAKREKVSTGYYASDRFVLK